MKKLAALIFSLLVWSAPIIAQCCLAGSMEKNSSYPAVALDSGKMVVMKCVSACTLTLPNPVQTAVWTIVVADQGSSQVSISSNGLLLNGSVGTFSIPRWGIWIISAAGTGYRAVQQNNGAGTTAIPYIDARQYGMRYLYPFTAPGGLGYTATITAGQTNATTASGSAFIDGDGVVIWGAGPTPTMLTPVAPAVTASTSASMTGSLLTVAQGGGGASYCYQIASADSSGGITAASPETCIANGAATLGLRTDALSATSITGHTVTATTTNPHGLSVGSMIVVANVGGAPNSAADTWNGWFIVKTVPNSTQFTYETLVDTGGGTSAGPSSSGSVNYWQCNHIHWNPTTGAFKSYIYGRVQGGNKTLIGVSVPQGTGLYGVPDDITINSFDDFGSPVTTLPYPVQYIPTNPSASPVNDYLSTTVASGGGTSTLVLANSASNSVTNGTLLMDSAIVFKAAVNAANALGLSVMIPQGSYTFNSEISLPIGTSVMQVGDVTLNEMMTWINTAWKGVGDFGNRSQFSFSPAMRMNINRANPGIYALRSVNVENLSISNRGANGQTSMIFEDSEIPSGTMRNIQFNVGNGGIDYSNMGVLMRSTSHSNSGCCWLMDDVSFTSSQNYNLVSNFPAWYVNNQGNFKITNLFFSGKGMLYRPITSGGWIDAEFVYSQGNYEPLFAVANPLQGGNLTDMKVNIKTFVLDTTFIPLVVSLGGLKTSLTLSNGGANYSLVSGVPFVAITANFAGPLNALNADYGSYSPFVNDGTFGRTIMPLRAFGEPIQIGSLYSLFTEASTPAAPTCTTAAGGNVNLGQAYYYYTPLYANGSEGSPSAWCAPNIVTGQQTVNISWLQIPGAISYNLYRATGGVTNFTALNCSPTTGLGWQDVNGFTCRMSPTQASTGGPAGLKGDMVWAQRLRLGNSLVGALPAAASNAGVSMYVTDSTAISAEGQTCAGGSTNGAVAISNGTVWKCF